MFNTGWKNWKTVNVYPLKKRKTSSDPWRNIFKNPWEASFSLQQSSFQWDQKPWGHHQTPVAFALSSSHGKPLNIFPRLKTPPVMKWLSCRNFAPPMASHEAKTRQCLTTEWMGRKSMGMIEAIEDVYVIFTLTPSVEAVLQCVVLEKRIASGWNDKWWPAPDFQISSCSHTIAGFAGRMWQGWRRAKP